MNIPMRARRSRTARVAAGLVCLAALAALAGCGAEGTGETGGSGGSAGGEAAPAPTTRFSENGVTVTLTVTDWRDSAGTLKAVFTPEEPGFHLYSTALPASGVDGVGRPTSVTVSGALRARGALTAGAPVRSVRLPGVDAPVPVYPDGPVTTTLPVRAGAEGEATVLVGYASCSTTEGCTIPVADRPVRLHVTADGPAFHAP
ncbi:hypothetical protein [Streptomyces sp. NPDC101132]|uniref:hypothetical protein n=1 Tax=Streptomyces sp. NPDC101132 TaxID=3366110 RepID=UPI00382CEA1D